MHLNDSSNTNVSAWDSSSYTNTTLTTSAYGFYVPRNIYLVQGSGQGRYPLTAFDHALLAAGIGDLNHLKVSSIVPGNCTVHKDTLPTPPITPGTLVPTVYSEARGERGQTISCCIACATCTDPTESGVIFEVSGLFSHETVVSIASDMVQIAMLKRSKSIAHLFTIAQSITVTDRYGCVVVAAVML